MRGDYATYKNFIKRKSKGKYITDLTVLLTRDLSLNVPLSVYHKADLVHEDSIRE